MSNSVFQKKNILVSVFLDECRTCEQFREKTYPKILEKVIPLSSLDIVTLSYSHHLKRNQYLYPVSDLSNYVFWHPCILLVRGEAWNTRRIEPNDVCILNSYFDDKGRVRYKTKISLSDPNSIIFWIHMSIGFFEGTHISISLPYRPRPFSKCIHDKIKDLIIKRRQKHPSSRKHETPPV